MKEPTKSLKRHELESLVAKRAATDESFRRELLAHPTETVGRVVGEMVPGARLPADLKVSIVEQTQGTYHLVVPAMPQGRDTRELSDADLDSVSGGVFGVQISIEWEKDQ
ncbi:MAG: NHLP leader peptide family natural product precursor [Candidatus Riflebacteria bacterium]|nr:NHLP leader peptide family natural product precursor [Candidatus Riflebacteria bacterium]